MRSSSRRQLGARWRSHGLGPRGPVLGAGHRKIELLVEPLGVVRDDYWEVVGLVAALPRYEVQGAKLWTAERQSPGAMIRVRSRTALCLVMIRILRSEPRIRSDSERRGCIYDSPERVAQILRLDHEAASQRQILVALIEVLLIHDAGTMHE